MKRSALAMLMLCAMTLTVGAPLTRARPEHRAMIGQELLHYRMMGHGSAVLLLSGGPGFSGDYMLPVAGELSKRYRSVLPDQRGTGRSQTGAPDSASINLKTAVEDLERLRERLRIEHWIILGHSWGGVLAMAYAAEYPARVRALVLIGSGSPVNFPDRTLGARIRARLRPADLQAMAYWSAQSRVAADPELAANEQFKAALPAYVFERRNVPKIMEHLAQRSFNPRVYQLMIQDLASIGYDLRPALKGFDRPVLVLQGRQDIVGEPIADEVHQAFSNSRLDLIEECGHFPWVDQPLKFFSITREFLKTVR